MNKPIVILCFIFCGMFWGLGMGWNAHIMFPDERWISIVSKIPSIILGLIGASYLRKL